MQKYFILQFKCNNVGNMYRDGIGCEANYDKAVSYYKIAAKENHPHAMCNLADIWTRIGFNFNKPKPIHICIKQQKECPKIMNKRFSCTRKPLQRAYRRQLGI